MVATPTTQENSEDYNDPQDCQWSGCHIKAKVSTGGHVLCQRPAQNHFNDQLEQKTAG